MNLLITAGATREPIDDVRYISNVSSGATGAALAAALATAGHEVTLLRGVGAIAPAAGPDHLQQIVFTSAAQLGEQLRRALATGTHDAVIMTAAVADFRVAQPIAGKLSSAVEQWSLALVRNPKLLPQLKAWSPRPLTVVGFKLTSAAAPEARQAAVAAQFQAGGVDAVVHNDLAEIRALPREQHPFWLYRAAGASPERIRGANALATALAGVLRPDRLPGS